MLDIQRRDQLRHTQYQANPKKRTLCYGSEEIEKRRKERKETKTVCRGLRRRDVKVPCHTSRCVQRSHIHTHTITHTHTRSHIHTSPSCSLVNGCCRQKTDLANVERVSQVGFEVPYKVINTAQHTARSYSTHHITSPEGTLTGTDYLR